MAEAHVNRHGRQMGRGWRPLWLIPKVLAVGLYLGSLAAAALLWFGLDHDALTVADLTPIRLLMVRLVVPSLLAALMLGAALTLQHPRVFAAMAWWRLKVAVLLLMIPGGHLYMASRVHHLRMALAQGDPPGSLATQISAGFVVVLALSALVVFLGRHKPRLGQNWARQFARLTPALLLTSVATAAGCADHEQPIRPQVSAPPTDLAVDFFVRGPERSDSRREVRSRYVLLPNRRLYLALGPAADPNRFPQHYLVLKPQQQEAILRTIRWGNLVAEPTSPGVKQDPPPRVTLDVDVTCWGRTNRYRTTSEESPPTRVLLDQFITMTGGELPADEEKKP